MPVVNAGKCRVNAEPRERHVLGGPSRAGTRCPAGSGTPRSGSPTRWYPYATRKRDGGGTAMSDATNGGWADRDSYLVSTDWLAEHLDDPKVRIVDCRYYFDGRVGHEEYAKGHIPGAVHLYYSELATKEDPIAFKMARGEQMKRVMEAHGVGDDTLVVAYDDEGGHAASRLWLAMVVHGHEDGIRILEGGLTKWQQEGRPLSTEPAAPRPATFTARPGSPNI